MAISEVRSYATMLIALALAYVVTGKAGMLLALPPSYATPVFPPAGIALGAVLLFGYRLLPGVWIGSFLMNCWITLDAAKDGTSALPWLLAHPTLPAGIATGAVLHSVVGAWTIRRLFGFPVQIEDGFRTLSTFFIGGPLACVVSATVGMGTVALHGLTAPGEFLIGWVNWWVGDSIGVFIALTLLLVWSPRAPFLSLGRKISITLPLVIMVALTIALFLFSIVRETAQIRNDFESRIRDFEISASSSFDDYANALNALDGFIATDNGEIDREHYVRFTRDLLGRIQGMRGMNWAPHVLDEERDAFEASMRRKFYPDYMIKQLDGHGAFTRAERRVDYYPVIFNEPITANRPSIGYDLMSEPNRADTLNRTRMSGKGALSAPIHLVQGPQDRYGYLYSKAVYAKDVNAGDPPLGFANLVMNMPEMMEPGLSVIEKEGFVVQISDESGGAGSERVTMYRSPAWPKDGRGLKSFGTRLLSFADRVIEVDLAVPSGVLTSHRSIDSWVVLALGLTFSGLVSLYLLIVAGRGSKIERLVIERTQELSAANERLAIEAEQNARLEAEARANAIRLAESNVELERFAAIASHDMQGSLRTIGLYSELLGRRPALAADEQAAGFVQAIGTTVDNMQESVRDILDLARYSSANLQLDVFPLSEVIAWVSTQLSAEIGAQQAEIISTEASGLLTADRRMIRQLLLNLIGNSLRFAQPEVRLRIEISLHVEARVQLLSVKDNGIGLEPGESAGIFELFSRASPESTPGHGLGLNICRKIASAHGGQIRVESEGRNCGATFFVLLPVLSWADATGPESE